ncbi:6-carboxytetrahydropterin synthase [soil metagenome]
MDSPQFPAIHFRIPTIRVTKQFRFEMAHALTGHDGPCRNIHGHSYCLSVTISGKPSEDPKDPKNGMVMDFADLKKIVAKEVVEQFDHVLVLNNSDKNLISITRADQKIIYFPFAPTCEMLLAEFHHRISTKLPTHIRLFSIRLDETATSFAEWYADDNL